MKICFVGDVHGGFDNLEFIANNIDCDIVMQLGDFGLWTDCVNDLPTYYKRKYNKPVYFVDGNHDNHDFLGKVKENHSDWKSGIELADNLVWMPRGSSLEIAEKRFFFCGGADSIDKEYRLAYYPDTWWSGEIITEEILEYASGRYDYVIAHDRPSFVSESLLGNYGKIGESSDVLSRLWGSIEVNKWVNGHWHSYSNVNIHNTQFITLDMLPSVKKIDKEYIEIADDGVNISGSIMIETLE